VRLSVSWSAWSAASGLSTAAAIYITNSPVPFRQQGPAAHREREPGCRRPASGSEQAALFESGCAAGSAARTRPRLLHQPRSRTGRRPLRAPRCQRWQARPTPRGALMLQTGAFKSAQDADSMRARLALLGLDARVSQVTQDGATVLYRVRIGPYSRARRSVGNTPHAVGERDRGAVVHTP